MNRTIKWGIAGTGRIAQQFAQDFEYVTNGELVAVSSRHQGSADKFAHKFGIPVAHQGYAQLLADPNVDAVYVASPHTSHYQNTADAIVAGKHVLCEKPLTVTPEECQKLLALAEKSDVFVMEAMWTYFLPAIQKAQQWVEEGRIGKIRQIKADFGYPQLPYDPERREYNVDLAGGCLLDMGIYPVALAWLFMQQDPVDIQALAHKAPNGVEDDLVMLFDYGQQSDGALAMLATSFRARLQNVACIIGDEGYIEIPDFFRAHECFLYQLDTQLDHFEDDRDSIGLNYEAIAVGEDINAGRQQNSSVPWSASLKFQQHMAAIKVHIN